MNQSNDRFDVDNIYISGAASGTTYAYDAVGNRTGKNAITYSYGNSDQLLSVTSGGTTNYGYDANLNQTTRGSDTFTWDHENRLIATSLGSSTYAYNSDGLRMSRTSNSVTTDYVWDVNRSIPVILQDGTNTYVYGLGLVSSTDALGDQTYRMTDGLGSTVGLCDGSGNMIATYVYDAFGIIRSQTGSSDNYWLFTGEQRDDESGYDYLRARYYDSEVGRFLGQDAAAPDWKVPNSLNRFAYAQNSPMVLVDPTGLYAACSTTGDLYREGLSTVCWSLDSLEILSLGYEIATPGGTQRTTVSSIEASATQCGVDAKARSLSSGAITIGAEVECSGSPLVSLTIMTFITHSGPDGYRTHALNGFQVPLTNMAVKTCYLALYCNLDVLVTSGERGNFNAPMGYYNLRIVITAVPGGVAQMPILNISRVLIEWTMDGIFIR